MRLARRAPDGVRIYAIGDVHGRRDLLEKMFALIDEDRAAQAGKRHVEVLLGDLIDRGPDSAGVLDMAITRKASHGLTVLRGNHDQYLLNALDSADTIPHWLNWGGVEALASWGIAVDADRAEPVDLLQMELRRRLPPAHLELVRASPLMARFGDILCVHAGIRPGVAIDNQSPKDLTLIREPFHSDARDHGVIVVHGHTPASEPVIRPNRVCVDTKAYESGELTCAVIEGDSLSFLAAVGAPGVWT